MAQLFEFVSNHFFLVGGFLVLLVLFVLNETRRGGREVSAQELVNLVNRDEAVVLDVRDRKEYQAGHITSALNIPFPTLEKRIDELKPHRDRTLVVICKMGQHSNAAGTLLRKAGFEKVARLSGGMMAWRNASLPVVKA
ncbi:MAG: rhodanese-like domain-containing protein [Pseudomonadales bacterium]|nr:rhodanese-like domain-containing protein [Pseudomonadales bacterium]